MWIKRALVIAAAALLMGILTLAIRQQPDLFQYAFIPPSLEEEQNSQGMEQQADEAGKAEAGKNSALEEFLKNWSAFREEQKDAFRAAVLSAHLPDAGMETAVGGSASGELKALYGDLHTLNEQVLVSGRRLYQEELDMGAPSAVLDEGLAIALFRQGDPVGMSFTLQGQSFTVVGVVRHSRALGDRAPYGLTVPLNAFPVQPKWELMTAQFLTTGGSGTRAGLNKALQSWQAGGQGIDLVKEKYRAMLPLRVLLCVMVLALAGIALRFAGYVTSRLLAGNRAALEKHYALRLMPRFLLTGLAISLMYAALVGIIILAFTQVLAPVYVFPEWVPAILVEPKEIGKTFWDNRTMASQLVALRTPELITLSAYGRYFTTLALLSGGLLLAPLHNLKRKAGELH